MRSTARIATTRNPCNTVERRGQRTLQSTRPHYWNTGSGRSDNSIDIDVYWSDGVRDEHRHRSQEEETEEDATSGAGLGA